MTSFGSFEAVIGLEVHAQLKTLSKAFSPDSAAFGGAPNTHVDSISLAHPGTLPVLNKRHIEYAILMGLATNCSIERHSIIARKHYFYPDLPKGYQISQYEAPICANGWLEVAFEGENGPEKTRVGITRIHIEEDAGKSIHDHDPYATLIDVNRCGVPLLEIVSEPDIRSAKEATAYLQLIWQMVRWLGICDGNMEEGSLRCDANISIRPKGETKFGTKAEIKNMNSFRNVERAIDAEITRQIKLVTAGGQVVQETRLWDVNRLETRPMRSKERAHDYRYFPDPDLPPVVISDEMLQHIAQKLPELPESRRKRFIKDWGLPAYDAQLLTGDRALADYLEETLALVETESQTSIQEKAKAVSNIMMTHVLRVLNESNRSITTFTITPKRLAELVSLRMANKISSTGAQNLFALLLEEDRTAADLAKANNLLQISDADALLPTIQSVLADFPKEVAKYRDGNPQLIGFFMGHVMKRFKGSPDPKLLRQMIAEQISALPST